MLGTPKNEITTIAQDETVQRVMRLQSLEYSEHVQEKQEWTLTGLKLGARNLIVGKNAAGKTRTLNVINGLSRILAGTQEPLVSGSYDATFVNEQQLLRYELDFLNREVVRERFSIDKTILLDRSKGGEGNIWADNINGGTRVKFQTPPSHVAAVARRDSLQHSFLEPLHQWGTQVRHYLFGSSLGKEYLAVIVEKDPIPFDERDRNAAVPIFRKGDKEFGKPFCDAIANDLNSIGYEVEEIGMAELVSAQIHTKTGAPVVGLFVKEKNLPGITDQNSLSQGMFRALAIFVHINYCQFKKSATCILIDDIGEGLDFDRSCRLIDVLREKTKDESIQLVLTTNDRFIMNRVPLEEWSVLQRSGGKVQVRNYENSQKEFEEFKFTGLSNFSFLEMDILNAKVTS